MRVLVLLFYFLNLFITIFAVGQLLQFAPLVALYMLLMAACSLFIAYWVAVDEQEINELRRMLKQQKSIGEKPLRQPIGRIIKKPLEVSEKLSCKTCALFNTSECPIQQTNTEAEICDEYVLLLEVRKPKEP